MKGIVFNRGRDMWGCVRSITCILCLFDLHRFVLPSYLSSRSSKENTQPIGCCFGAPQPCLDLNALHRLEYVTGTLACRVCTYPPPVSRLQPRVLFQTPGRFLLPPKRRRLKMVERGRTWKGAARGVGCVVRAHRRESLHGKLCFVLTSHSTDSVALTAGFQRFGGQTRLDLATSPARIYFT